MMLHHQEPKILFIALWANSTPRLDSGVSWDAYHQQQGKGQDIQSGRVRRHRSCQSRSESREKRLEPSVAVYRANRSANCRSSIRTLHPRLHRIDWEHGNPHGNAGRTACGQNRCQRQVASDVPVGVLGRQAALDVLICGKVRRRARAVSSQCHGTATEHTANSTFLIQLPHDVQTTRVLGLLTGRGRILALNLQQHFHSLEWGRDQRHWDCRKGAGGGDLGDGVLGDIILDWDRRQSADKGLAQVVTLGEVRTARVRSRSVERRSHGHTQKLTATENKNLLVIVLQQQRLSTYTLESPQPRALTLLHKAPVLSQRHTWRPFSRQEPHTLASPSRATVFLTTSIAPV